MNIIILILLIYNFFHIKWLFINSKIKKQQFISVNKTLLFNLMLFDACICDLKSLFS